MSDTVDKAKAWDTLAKRSAKITRLTARVAELEAELADFRRFVWEQFGYKGAEQDRAGAGERE
jgi:phage gp16-like protein